MNACLVRLNGFHTVLFCLAIFSCHSLLFSQNLIITELYRNPPGAENALCAGASHEFVEITNLGCDTFFIDKFFISDGAESDTVVPFGCPLPSHLTCITDQFFIAPGQIALILDSDYKKAIETHNCLLPVENGTVLFRCSDSELGNGLTDDEGVLLYKGTRQRIDSVVCLLSDSPLESESPVFGKLVFSQPQNIEGFSIEATRLLFNKNEYEISKSSLSPGYIRQMQNGFLVEWEFGLYSPGQGEIICTLHVYNSDLNYGGGGWILKKGDYNISEGNMQFKNHRADLIFPLKIDSADYRFSINKTEWLIEMSSLFMPQSPVKINEIYPFASQNETEWVELINASSMSINLKNWSIGNSEDTAPISKNEILLCPGAYIVIAKNRSMLLQLYPDISPVIQPSSWHTLNNHGDTVCIFDANGQLRDMVCYKSSWFAGTNGVLERINYISDGCDSANWAQSNQGGTPGYPNNALFWRDVAKTQMWIGPVPFTPNNDGKNDLLCIKMAVAGSQTINICIYGFDGSVMRVFNGPIQKEYFWDGKDDKGRAQRCGPFIVVAEVTASKGKTFLRKKGVLWR